jgi:ferredoxin
MPYNCYTSYIAKINEEDCIGCGTCVQKCPMETIDLEDAMAVLNPEKCIGCGVCVHNCPEEAIELERTGLRQVFVPPPKLKMS